VCGGDASGSESRPQKRLEDHHVHPETRAHPQAAGNGPRDVRADYAVLEPLLDLLRGCINLLGQLAFQGANLPTHERAAGANFELNRSSPGGKSCGQQL